MPTVVEKTVDINETVVMFQKLTQQQQQTFAKEIRKQYILNYAKKLDSIGEPSELTMEEIVAETKTMRREQEAKDIANAKK